VGSEAAKYNPYSGKVVVMDEAHHLTRPHRLFKFQLENLRGYLRDASDLALLAVTGSMLEDNVKDLKALLDAVKGASAPLCAIQPLLHHRLLPKAITIVWPSGGCWRSHSPNGGCGGSRLAQRRVLVGPVQLHMPALTRPICILSQQRCFICICAEIQNMYLPIFWHWRWPQ